MIALYQPLAVTMHYFLEAVLVGLCLGIFYDVLAGAAMVYGKHRWAAYLTDGIFWLAALVVYFVFTVTLAAGQVRGFLVIGMGGGILFCHLAVGWLVQKMTCTILQLLVWIVRILTHYTQMILHFMQAGWKWFQKNLKKFFKKTSISGKKTL